MATLTGLKIKDSYDGLLKTANNLPFPTDTIGVLVQDGLGNNSPIRISTTAVSLGGSGSTISGVQCVNLGNNNVVGGNQSMAVGNGHIIASGSSQSMAFGNAVEIDGIRSYGFGNKSTIVGNDTFVVGTNNNVDNQGSVVFGNDNNIPNIANLAVQQQKYSKIIGNNNTTQSTNWGASLRSTIIGNNNIMDGDIDSVIIGTNTNINGQGGNVRSVAIGLSNGIMQDCTDTITMGKFGKSYSSIGAVNINGLDFGLNNVTIGFGALNFGSNCVAIRGYTEGNNSISISGQAYSNNSISIGENSFVDYGSVSGTAVGFGATVQLNHNFANAFGYNVQSLPNATVIGKYNDDAAISTPPAAFVVGIGGSNANRKNGMQIDDNGGIIFNQLHLTSSFTNDTTAAAGGVDIGQLYRTGSSIKIRVS
jgi:hypothetical protein